MIDENLLPESARRLGSVYAPLRAGRRCASREKRTCVVLREQLTRLPGTRHAGQSEQANQPIGHVKSCLHPVLRSVCAPVDRSASNGESARVFRGGASMSVEPGGAKFVAPIGPVVRKRAVP